jgi:hypothetical protein
LTPSLFLMDLDALLSNPLISPGITVEKFTEPYNHVVLRNVFREEVYDSMCRLFPGYISRCRRPHGAVGTGGHFYDALIYSMLDADCVGGWEFFVQKAWQDYMASVFALEFTPHTAYSLHFHNGSHSAPSKSGWSHLDLSVCSVSARAKSGEVEITQGFEYADDSWDRQPHARKVLRSVAMLFYLNNPQGGECSGGGTGIYSSYNTANLVKTIQPENNSLFAFEIGPDSYHGFVGANYDRSAMVQWFHSSPSYIVHRSLPKFQDMWRREGRIFEHWKKENRWSLEMDPDYTKYFSEPLANLLGPR